MNPPPTAPPRASTTAPAAAPMARPRKVRLRPRVMKLIRRIHLYTGLLLLPWVIFFGFSGMLFNHPELGPRKVIARFDKEITGETGFQRLNPEVLAAGVVAALNEAAGGRAYRRAMAGDAVIEGEFVFQGVSAEGPVVIALNPHEGNAVVTRTPEATKTPPPPFLSSPLPAAEGLDKTSLQAAANSLLEIGGIRTLAPVEASPRGGAELRFQLESEDSEQRWNLSWNLAQGTLAARELGTEENPDLYSVLTRFHKTHHYPTQMGARWLWSALGDATGLTMVFWGISGAIMWWQMKPTRLLGIAGLSVAAVVALFVFAGTYSHIHWVPRGARPAPATTGQVNPDKNKKARSSDGTRPASPPPATTPLPRS